MTTNRSTGSKQDGVVPEADSASPPPWLPDEATLNRLAGEIFSGLPGAFGGASSVAPGADLRRGRSIFPISRP